MKLKPHEVNPVITMTAIGNVCLQWSRFEISILMVIFALEDIPPEKGDIIYGGLDWKPRLNMAINLAEYHKAPHSIRKRLRALRNRIRNEDLNERRNQVVHGAQSASEGGKTNFMMSRWPQPKKIQALSPVEIGALGTVLMEIGQEAAEIFDAIGAWKFPEHCDEDHGHPVTEPNSVSLFKLAQNTYARIKNFWR